MPTSADPSLRAHLLDAALRLVEQDGPLAVTTKRIALLAGCSEGSIYNHFAGKDELLATVIAERVAVFPARADELASAPGTGDVRAHLVDLATLAVHFFRRGVPMMAVAHDHARMRERCHDLHAKGLGPWRAAESIAGWLRAEQRLGRVAVDVDPLAAATGLLGTCMYHAVVARTWGDDGIGDDAEVVDRAVTAVWQGLAPT